MSEQIKDVEKMITKVMKKKDLSRTAAIAYMLTVATGRLSALWRYDESLPEGKATKGVFELRARKKPAEKSPRIGAEAAAEKPKRKPARKRKPKAVQQEQELSAAE